MKSNTKSIITLLLCIFSLQSFATTNHASNYTQVIAARFSEIWRKQPQEKVYVHTDKPYYSAGENIWFKAYLMNASTHLPNTLSRFIYVELVNNMDSIVIRHKIRKDSIGFSGFINLSPKLPAGYYSLRAYTNWMQNASSEFNFTKSIYIGNNIDDRINCKIQYSFPENKTKQAQLTFTNTFQTPLAGITVNVTQNWMKSYKNTVALTTNKAGVLTLPLSDLDIVNAKKTINIHIDEPGYKFSHKYIVPELSDDFDVKFFPESGTLLNSGIQICAFKAIGSDGLSTKIEGTIYNNSNEIISMFSAAHKGMGKVAFSTNPGESYYAIVKSAKGVEKRFELPATQSKGIVIHLRNAKENIVFETTNTTLLADSSLFLLVHSRGKPVILQALTKSHGQIAEKILPEGIVSFSIIDSLGNIYCERLCFVKRNYFPIIEMQTSKPGYGKRELVEFDLKINSQYGASTAGNYSVSVTDSKTVIPDSASNTIVSYLLLSSDIKGHIEEPAEYFYDNSRITIEKLDLLMLTQGWRRFNTAEVVKGNYKQSEKFFMEIGQALSGKVLNVFAKPVKNTEIIMFMGYKNGIGTTKTDSIGRYILDGIEFPDSTSIMLKAKKNKNIADVEIIPDKDVFTEPNCYFPKTIEELIPAPSDYFQINKEKFYSEGGIMVVSLMDVEIKASKKTLNNANNPFAGFASNNITSEKLEQYPGMTLMDLLTMEPGIQVNGEQVSIRGSQNQPLFLVDEIETDNMSDLTYLTSNDIENISIFKGADASIYGSKGGSGVIAITLKKGFTKKTITPSSLVHLNPLGFQKPIEFYHPKYDVDSIKKNPKQDLRTTIYWNPKLIADSAGTLKVKFYTADKANNYSVELEGITNKGEICRFRGHIRREGY